MHPNAKIMGPHKLSRAYDRLWDSLDYDGDHRHLEGVTRASVSSVLSELQETIERYENGSDTARNNARLASKTEAHEAARRVMASLHGRVPVFTFAYGS